MIGGASPNPVRTFLYCKSCAGVHDLVITEYANGIMNPTAFKLKVLPHTHIPKARKPIIYKLHEYMFSWRVELEKGKTTPLQIIETFVDSYFYGYASPVRGKCRRGKHIKVKRVKSIADTYRIICKRYYINNHFGNA